MFTSSDKDELTLKLTKLSIKGPHLHGLLAKLIANFTLNLKQKFRKEAPQNYICLVLPHLIPVCNQHLLQQTHASY